MKMKTNFLTIMILTVSLCATSALFALDGHWINTQIYPPTINDWSTPGMWAGGTVADGSGFTAYFTNGIDSVGIGAIKGISMGAGPSISHIVAALDVNDYSAYYALVAGTLTLVGTPTIDVADTNNLGGLVLGFPGFGGSLAGSAGFTKTGSGKLFVDQPNSISGTINANGGWVYLRDPDAAQNADVVVSNSAILIIEGRTGTNNVKSITVNDGGIVQLAVTGAILSTSINVKSGGILTPVLNETVASGSNITVESGGSVYCGDNINFTIDNDITFVGNGTQGGGIEIWNNVAHGTYNGTMTLSGNGRVFCHGAVDSMTFNGPFVGTAGGSLEIIGQGASDIHTKLFNMNAKNTHNGPTSLRTFASESTYEINTDDCFPSDQALLYLIHNWGTTYCNLYVDMNDYKQQVSSLDFNCGAGGDYIQLLGNAGSKVSVAGNVNQSGGTAEVTTCELEVGGVLTVNGTMIGMDNVTLLPGAAVSGIGTIDALTVPAGAALAPGSSIGTLNTGNLTLEKGCIYNWEVSSNEVADLISISGNLLLPGMPAGANSVTVNVNNVGDILPTDTNVLFTLTGGAGPLGTIYLNYSGLAGPENPEVVGSDVFVTGITPEPSTLGLLAILGLAFSRRK